jgi:hypothetical protein
MQRGLAVRVLSVSLLLSGCGSTDSNPRGGPSGGPAAMADGGTSAGGTSGGGTSGGGVASLPSGGGADAEPSWLVANLWGMFAFEDPVAISLNASAHQLSGEGCFAGLPRPSGPASTCKTLSGTIEGRHLQFSFRAEAYTYAADVYISSNQQRMAGRFHDIYDWRLEPTAWLPIGPTDAWLTQPAEPSALETALASRAGSYELRATEASTAEPLRLNLNDGHQGVIFSSLGAFWGSEVSWNEEEQTLTAGPVPETVPDLPIQLTLRFDAALLVRVEALLPSGEMRAYSAQPVTP